MGRGRSLASLMTWYGKATCVSEVIMLYALIFLASALISGALGFSAVAGATFGVARILFFVFLGLCAVCLVMRRRRRT